MPQALVNGAVLVWGKVWSRTSKSLAASSDRLTNSLLLLIDTFWRNATLHQPCPSSAMHCNVLTLAAAHFLGGGETLGQERWGKEQAGGASSLYPRAFCQRLARGSGGSPCRVQRCCWWTGFFCNLRVGCADSLAEGNLQLLHGAKALLLALCWQKKGNNCGPVNIAMHMLAQTGLCTPYAVCPNAQDLVPVFQAFHSLSSFLCRGILVSGMQFLWCHQCWV